MTLSAPAHTRVSADAQFNGVCDDATMTTSAPQPDTGHSAQRVRWLRRFVIHRSSDDRVVAGVAAGLAARLGVDPMLVRIGLIPLAFAGGFGVLLYAVLWLTSVDDGVPHARRPVTTQQGVALTLITLGVLFLLRGIGLWFGDAIVVPVIVAAAGSAIVWTRSDDDDRQRWTRATTKMSPEALSAAAAGPMSPARLGVGALLVAFAAGLFLTANAVLDGLWELGLALIVAFAGVALLFGPWMMRLVQQLGDERRERIRQEERAELAAHLHDSVLQTLALIQRSPDDPQRMVGLARRQERELRRWLYRPEPADRTSIVRAMRAIADDIEAHHAVTVEVVTVGDADVGEHERALIGAIRESCLNAARHAAVDRIDVFVETDDTKIVAFVRDRGCGFDPTAVADDRHGVRESIIGRLRRQGGDATIVSSADAGTEVEMRIARSHVAQPDQRPEPLEALPARMPHGPSHAPHAPHAPTEGVDQ